MTPHPKRFEEPNHDILAFGCSRRPCIRTADFTNRTVVARSGRPTDLDDCLVTLTVTPEARVPVRTGESVVTIQKLEADGNASAAEHYWSGESAVFDNFGTLSIENVAVRRSVIHHYRSGDLVEPTNGRLLLIRASFDAEEDAELTCSANFDAEHVHPAKRVPLTSDSSTFEVSVPVRQVDDTALVLEADPRSA